MFTNMNNISDFHQPNERTVIITHNDVKVQLLLVGNMQFQVSLHNNATIKHDVENFDSTRDYSKINNDAILNKFERDRVEVKARNVRFKWEDGATVIEWTKSLIDEAQKTANVEQSLEDIKAQFIKTVYINAALLGITVKVS